MEDGFITSKEGVYNNESEHLNVCNSVFNMQISMWTCDFQYTEGHRIEKNV